MKLPRPIPWIAAQGQLCENPLWDDRRGYLYWTDIPSGHLHRVAWGSRHRETIYEGIPVGGFTLQADGNLALFREADLALFDPKAGVVTASLAFDDPDARRFNDVAACPDGRVLAGTIGRNAEIGGLYLFETDGRWRKVASGTGCSNGMAFSPRCDWLYWVCSTRRIIFRFRYPLCKGAPEIFHEVADGIPDGLTVDREGNLYSVRWGAKEENLCVISPEGMVLNRVRIPAHAATSLAFCGPHLHHAAITAAADTEDPARSADLFLLGPLPVAGRVEFRSQIRLG